MENTKFDMFAGLEERNFNEEIVVPEQETELEVQETAKKKFSTGIHRTKEEYESHIESTYFETHTHPVSGEEYQVRVTVLKPEVNPLENMRPVFAYSTNH